MKKKRKSSSQSRNKFRDTLVAVVFCVIAGIAIGLTIKAISKPSQRNILAADYTDSKYEKDQSGLGDIVKNLNGSLSWVRSKNVIGSSCENVVIGQRVAKLSSKMIVDNNSSISGAIEKIGEKSKQMVGSPKLMSDDDYENLLKIVEAEAGTEDLKGRILVANVILNRVKSTEFPNNVTDVIYQQEGDVYQFSPVLDGRIDIVTPTKTTIKAVTEALKGKDYSKGALFFLQKNASEKHNVQWFEKDLKRLFKHGDHDFYTYPNGKNA